MPNIKTYDAPAFSLTESDKGGQAWSQAGRRLGPLYNEAAQFAREAGKLAADNKAQLWPLDILELYQKNAAKSAGGGIRVRGSIDPNSTLGDYGDMGQANGQVSQGAAAMGQALSDGGRAVSQKQQDPNRAPAGAPQEAMTLDHGDLVTVSAARKAMQEYNSEQVSGMTKYQKDLETYGKVDPSIYSTDWSSGSPQPGAGNPAPPSVGGYFTNQQTGGWGFSWNSGGSSAPAPSGGSVDTSQE